MVFNGGFFQQTIFDYQRVDRAIASSLRVREQLIMKSSLSIDDLLRIGNFCLPSDVCWFHTGVPEIRVPPNYPC